MNCIGILGIVSAVIIFVSSLFKNVLYLRIVNLIGSALFCAYGILTGAVSVWLLNGGLIITQIYQIIILIIKKRRHDRMKKWLRDR